MLERSGLIEDRQRVAFNDLIHTKVPNLIKSHSMNLSDDCVVTFEPVPIVTDKVHTKDNTDYVVIRTKCILENKNSRERVETNIDLLNLPVFQDLGFRIGGNFMQVLDVYDRTLGWSFVKRGKSGDVLTEVLSSNGSKLVLGYTTEKMLPQVLFKDSSGGNKKEKKNIPVDVFLRSITGYTNSEILSMFGYDNPFICEIFNDEGSAVASYKLEEECVTKADCIDLTVKAMLGSTSASRLTSLTMKQRELENQLFNPNYRNMESNYSERLNYIQSFKYRANGKILAEDVDCNGYHFEEGTVLTIDVLEILDNLPITRLKVSYANKNFVLKKFSTFTFRALGFVLAKDCEGIPAGKELTIEDLEILNNSNNDTIFVSKKRKGSAVFEIKRLVKPNHITVDDFFTAIGIWTDNLNGFDTYDNEFELTNRIVIPFDKLVISIVDNYLTKVTSKLADSVSIVENDSLVSMIPDFSKFINLDEFINRVKSTDNRSGQMSDMCNAVAFVSKDYKVTSTIKSDPLPPGMVNIQDLQESRLDAFDAPESDKIGVVHHRCILTEMDESGYLRAPYLRVKSGEVVSEEPVYLTAIEEADQFIAEWNETFLNEDGTKKEFVRARCNGDILNVSIDNVLYKEYSPYQSMSPSHATIPFPGHSNGKRITMGCNQVKQAVPTVKRERPCTNAGGESLVKAGVYCADDVLQRYYHSLVSVSPEMKKYQEKILSSDLILESISTNDTRRTLTYTVEFIQQYNKANDTKYNDQAVLSISYLLKTFEETMLSYDINHKEGRRYSCTDILAYNNGYSLDNPDRVDLIDTGAQKVDSSVFDSGLALAKNLKVAYKTYGGSTIDDAITISSRLVDDDELTSISLITKTVKLFNSETRRETFAYRGQDYPYFQVNGLPKIGTRLGPGDPIICKSSELISGSQVSSVGQDDEHEVTYQYTFLNQYTEGQVVRTGIKTTNKGKEAFVVLATRSQIEVGDKMAGRCGNKGVVARIVPYEEMPVIPTTGEVIDIVLNPLGVPSRQNISQLLDAALSYCMKSEDKISIVSPYHPDDIDFVREQMENHDLKPIHLIDGRTGELYERPVNYGVLPMYKLHHMVRKKIHAIGIDPPVSPDFLQPKKGSKSEGGQSFGEMESWCLEGIGCRKVLQDLYSIQSDDIVHKNRNKVLLESGREVTSSGENHNDNGMLSFYRSIGCEFVSDTENGEYGFVPLTDEIVRTFNVMPVDGASALHSQTIFGKFDDLDQKADARGKWSYIDLKVKIINPIWINHSKILSLIFVQNGDSVYHLNKDLANEILEGSVYVLKESVPVFNIYKKDKSSARGDYRDISSVSVDRVGLLETGMKALVWMFENASVDTAIKMYDRDWSTEFSDDMSRETENSKVSLLKMYRTAVDFKENGQKLSDYVISLFPVMPQSFRPVLGISVRERPDFDWHYIQIMNAAKAAQIDDSQVNLLNLYYKIGQFEGVFQDDKKSSKKYTNLRAYFGGTGKDKDHGKIRSAMQSKRLVCSGRTTIIPAVDVTMKPTEIGVPITMLVRMYESVLIGYFKKKSEEDSLRAKKIKNRKWRHLFMHLANDSFKSFKKVYQDGFDELFNLEPKDAFSVMKQWIISCVEGKDGAPVQAVLAGRQPSLHKYSIRAYRPKVVFTKAINIHPLVCKGYNADFDGDQMWVAALLSRDAIEEALCMMSPAKDFINPKNSKIMLEHSQDIALGIYCATMLDKNVINPGYTLANVKYYSILESLITDVKAGILKTYDLVCFQCENGRVYLSTAGRIWFNSLVVDGFTDKPFTNQFNIAGIKKEKYSELRFDGIITSGGATTGTDRVDADGFVSLPVYYNLQDICKEMYLSVGEECIENYQKLSEFGFFMSDRFGMTLSLFDMDIVSSKDKIIEEVSELKRLIEIDYQDGLISEEDKTAAIKSLYNDSKNGALSRIQKDLLAGLERNNNLFIMMDSGARGNKTQAMYMCGAIGILQKTKTEDMEDAVTTNYYQGLGSFDVHMAAYSARIGVESTQNETKKAGRGTRQIVYLTSGVEIVEEDCGKKNWWYDVSWDDRKDELDKFIPSDKWFNEHLLGRRIDPSDVSALKVFGLEPESNVITEDSFFMMSIAGGFHSIRFVDDTGVVTDTITVSIYDLEGKTLAKSDKEGYRYLSRLLDNGKLTKTCIDVIDRKSLKSIETVDGVYTFRYKMNQCDKSLLLHREAMNLKYLRKVKDRTFGKELSVITEDTLDFIENEGIERVNARVLLDCNCKHGICAHCYGLKFSDLQLPKIGSFVGIESAQSAGEPAAQLTMSLINKGGAAGESIASGVDVFMSLLGGNVSNNSDPIVVTNGGYVHVDKLDNTASVTIEPEDKNCDMCRLCMSKQPEGKCPLYLNKRLADPLCQIKTKLMTKNIVPVDGEWVDSGDFLLGNLLSKGVKTPVTVPANLVVSVKDSTDPKLVLRKKQVIWMMNYFFTFLGNNISINARHFEILARIQNLFVLVTDAGETDLKVGEYYEFNEVMEKGGNVKFLMKTSSNKDVILRNSGAFTALSFEDYVRTASRLVVSGYRSSFKHNNSMIGALSIGEDVSNRRMKEIKRNNVIVNHNETKEKTSNVSLVEVASSAVSELDSFDLDSKDLFSGLNFDFGDTFNTASNDFVEESLDSNTIESSIVVMDSFSSKEPLEDDAEEVEEDETELNTDSLFDLAEEVDSLDSDESENDVFDENNYMPVLTEQEAYNLSGSADKLNAF